MSLSISKAAFALALPAMMATSIPAAAAPVAHGPVASAAVTAAPLPAAHGDRHERRYGRGDSYYYRGGDGYRQRAYARPQQWRGDDGRYYCRRPDGTTGTVVGAVVGGVLGHEVAGRGGDRTLGVILGAAGGALLGRSVDRGGSRCR